MNIGIVVDNDFSFDVRVTREAKVLQKAGYQVFVLCFDFGQIQYPELDGITMVRIKWQKVWKDRLFVLFHAIPIYERFWARRIGQFIKRYNIQVLHTHDLYMSKAAHRGILKSGKDVPLILDLHENFPAAVRSYNWAKGKWRRLVIQPQKWASKEEEYLGYADKIIVLSEYFKKDLCDRYDSLRPDDFVVFPNVIDFDQFASFAVEPVETQLVGLKKLFLYFGGVAERRGIFEAIAALKAVLNKGYEMNLLIIGPVDKADKERFNHALNDPAVKHNLFHFPWRAMSTLPSYMQICDVCLSPLVKNAQHESGVANKIYQYMFGKKPILASNCRPQQDLIEKYNCGLVYTDQQEFIQHLITFIEQPDLIIEMGKNGYNGLMADYNSPKFNNLLIHGYQDLENKRRIIN